VAIGVTVTGEREVLGLDIGSSEFAQGSFEGYQSDSIGGASSQVRERIRCQSALARFSRFRTVSTRFSDAWHLYGTFSGARQYPPAPGAGAGLRLYRPRVEEPRSRDFRFARMPIQIPTGIRLIGPARRKDRLREARSLPGHFFAMRATFAPGAQSRWGNLATGILGPARFSAPLQGPA